MITKLAPIAAIALPRSKRLTIITTDNKPGLRKLSRWLRRWMSSRRRP